MNCTVKRVRSNSSCRESDHKLKQVEQEKAELERDRERRIATRREKIEKRFAYLYPSVKVSHHRSVKTMAGMSDDDVIAIEKQFQSCTTC